MTLFLLILSLISWILAVAIMFWAWSWAPRAYRCIAEHGLMHSRTFYIFLLQSLLSANLMMLSGALTDYAVPS